METALHPRHAELGFPLRIEEIVAVLLFTCSASAQEELTMAQLSMHENTYQKCEEYYNSETQAYCQFREGFLNNNRWFVWPRLLNSAITKIALTDPQAKPRVLYHAIAHINLRLGYLKGQRNYD